MYNGHIYHRVVTQSHDIEKVIEDYKINNIV